jgi:integrase
MLSAIEIFFCYSREDDILKKELDKHLKGLKREALIKVWHDREIVPGTDWEREIDKHLNQANIILLLVSPDFMASDYCYSKEMIRAMQRHEAEEARVIPIILRPCHWKSAPFGSLQALPTDGKPVKSAYWHSLDDAFYDIVEGIRDAVETTAKNLINIAELKYPIESLGKTDDSNTYTITKVHTYRPSLDKQVSLWLQSRGGRTRELYEDKIAEFRELLHSNGLDLDSGGENAIASLCKQWASQVIEIQEISASTYNLRCSIVSSFYVYARKQRWTRTNPIELVERREDKRPNAAQPLDLEIVKNNLRLIDRSTLRGKRDYALLCTLFATGRTVSEVAYLRCGDIAIEEDHVTVTFQRCKGGKVISKTLPRTSVTAQALIDYLMAAYGNDRAIDAPVWKSYSRQHRNSKTPIAISTQAISDVCDKYLGTTKVQTTKHTVDNLTERAAKEIEKMLDLDDELAP